MALPRRGEQNAHENSRIKKRIRPQAQLRASCHHVTYFQEPLAAMWAATLAAGYAKASGIRLPRGGQQSPVPCGPTQPQSHLARLPPAALTSASPRARCRRLCCGHAAPAPRAAAHGDMKATDRPSSGQRGARGTRRAASGRARARKRARARASGCGPCRSARARPRALPQRQPGRRRNRRRPRKRQTRGKAAAALDSARPPQPRPRRSSDRSSPTRDGRPNEPRVPALSDADHVPNGQSAWARLGSGGEGVGCAADVEHDTLRRGPYHREAVPGGRLLQTRHHTVCVQAMVFRAKLVDLERDFNVCVYLDLK
eukprot:3905749-Prymnesium_polylepis.2